MEAWKLTGYKIDEKELTRLSFQMFKRENRLISLDEAILKFEKAEPNTSLNEFAEKKNRTAENYRKTYKKYFIGN
jgi:zona occludens toxin (predicted ATPase)